MIRKIIAISLVLVGGLLAVVIVAGGTLFPHILGPTALVVVGTILLALPGKAK
jgi:hypothetical protein